MAKTRGTGIGWQALKSPFGKRRPTCPSDGELGRFLEGALEESERDRLLSHLVRCPHCCAVAALAGFEPEELAPPAASAAQERALRMLDQLPLALLRVGVAREGMKLLRRRRASLVPDRARVRLRGMLEGASGRFAVCPPDAGDFLVSFDRKDIALHLATDGRAVTGSLQGPGPGEDAVQADVLAGDRLLLSETLAAGASLALPELAVGQDYRIAFGRGLRAEVSLGIERMVFTAGDLASLCLYHFAAGKLREALRVCNEELLRATERSREAARLGALIRRFLEPFPPGAAPLAVPVVRRQSRGREPRVRSIVAILRGHLEHQESGRWAGLPILREGAAPDRDAVTRLWDEVRAAAARQPDNDELQVASSLLEAWLHADLKDVPEQVSVSALSGLLEKVLSTDGPDRQG